MCVPSDDRTVGQRADQGSFRALQGVGWSTLRMQSAPSAARRGENHDCGCGRNPAIAGSASQRADDGSGHADTVTAGGPRRPMISATMPANTCRGSAAAAIWKTASLTFAWPATREKMDWRRRSASRYRPLFPVRGLA